MNSIKVHYIILMSFLHTLCLAQRPFDTSVISRNMVRNNPMVLYEIADSFSQKGDSIGASNYLLKISPYYSMANGTTPENLNKLFDDLKITMAARNIYRDTFMKSYNKPISKTHDTLAKIYEEDQLIRKKLPQANDSFTIAFYTKKMLHDDSAHFKWLFNYVQKNGWPTLQDGSVFAQFVALHDHQHWCDYLPYLRKAVYAGNGYYTIYNILLNRCLQPSFELLIKQRKHLSFDVSCILKGDSKKLASEFQKMKIAIKNNPTISYIYFRYESKKKCDFDNFIHGSNHNFSNADEYWMSWNLMMAIDKCVNGYNDGTEIIPYDYIYSESDIPQPKLKLYLLY
jgi:hypothetical protein